MSNSPASRGAVALLAGVLSLLAGCAGLPSLDSLPTDGTQWIQTASPDCELPSAEEALRAAVGDDPQALAFVRRVGALETALTRRPVLSGNAVDLLVDGPATHAAQLAAIAEAQHHVHLEVFILTDEKLGQQYAAALSARADAGVKIRLLFDGVGALGMGPDYVADLRSHGVEIVEVNSVNPLEEPRIWRVNRRSHRKLLVVDGRVAFTGGVNIMDEYAESSPGSAGSSGSSGSSSSGRSSSGGASAGSSFGKGSKGSKGSRGRHQLGWRDTHIRVEGPAVAEFQRVFVRNWERTGGKRIESGPEYWPPTPARGDNLVRVVTSEGTDFLGAVLGIPDEIVRTLLNKSARVNTIYSTYIGAISEARSRVWITQAYFAPGDDFVELLGDAAGRGVDVRLVVPARSDVGLLPLAARHYYTRLLKAGVKLFEYDPVMIHAKTAVVDGVWSTVGSSNLDFRSFIHNDEANAIVIGRAFAAQMEKLFEQDLQQSTQITLAEWKKRPWLDRVKETGAAAIKYWL